jgi:hypothetical protein
MLEASGERVTAPTSRGERMRAGKGEGDAVKTERQKTPDTALEEFDAVALVVTCLQRALAQPWILDDLGTG